MARWYDLFCPRCEWQESCDSTAAQRFLVKVRLARPHILPEAELLPELVRVGCKKFPCPGCGGIGLVQGVRGRDEPEPEPQPGAKFCADCGRIISEARLAAVPDADLCLACQERADG